MSTRVFERTGFPGRVGPAGFLGLALLSQVAGSFVQQGIAVLGVFFAGQFHLSLAVMGTVVSSNALGMMVGFTFTGSLADRWGPRKVLALGAVAMVLATCLTAVSEGFAMLLASLFILGVFTSVIPSAGSKSVFMAFSGRPRGLPMAIRQTGVPLGSAISAFVLPVLAYQLGFKPLFFSMAGMLLIFQWLFAWFIPGTPMPSARPVDRVKVSWREAMGPIWIPAVVAILMAAGQYDVLTFSIPDLHSHHGVSLATAGIVLAAAQVGGGLARIFFGTLSDRIGGHRARLLFWIGLLAALFSAVVAVLPQHMPAWILIPLWFVWGVGTVGWNALVIVWVGERVDPARSGWAMSLTASIVFVGAVGYPPLFGWVVDTSHQFFWGWMMMAAIMAVAAGVCRWAVVQNR